MTFNNKFTNSNKQADFTSKGAYSNLNTNLGTKTKPLGGGGSKYNLSDLEEAKNATKGLGIKPTVNVTSESNYRKAFKPDLGGQSSSKEENYIVEKPKQQSNIGGYNKLNFTQKYNNGPSSNSLNNNTNNTGSYSSQSNRLGGGLGGGLGGTKKLSGIGNSNGVYQNLSSNQTNLYSNSKQNNNSNTYNNNNKEIQQQYNINNNYQKNNMIQKTNNKDVIDVDSQVAQSTLR